MAEALNYLRQSRPMELIKRTFTSPVELATQSLLSAIGVVGVFGIAYCIAGPGRR
jgi:hypothetical protein